MCNVNIFCTLHNLICHIFQGNYLRYYTLMIMMHPCPIVILDSNLLFWAIYDLVRKYRSTGS